MSLLGRLEAMARGEVSTAALYAFASGNGEAYSLLDVVPPVGTPRLAAWCAFILQTYGDNLLSSGSTPGYTSEPAYEEARLVYELVGPWLERARRAAADPEYELGCALPQRLPRPPAGVDLPRARATRKTLEIAHARVAADLRARSEEAVHDRLAPMLDGLRSSIDAGGAIFAPHVDSGVVIALSQTLHDALDQVYELGQLLARPELVSPPSPPPPPRATAASILMFRPGDSGFDPWCMTDPVERREREHDEVSARKLTEFWQRDPEPARTLAVQAEIAGALEHGLVDYLPAGEGGWLHELSSHCPWPGVLYAVVPVTVGGTAVSPGAGFVFVVRPTENGFERVIETRSLPGRFAATPASTGVSRLLDRLAGDDGKCSE